MQHPEDDEDEDNDDVEPMTLDGPVEQNTFSLPEDMFPLSRDTLPPFVRPPLLEELTDIDLEDDEDALMRELEEEDELDIEDESIEKEQNEEFREILD